jgi:ribosomal protein S18 acetylase RimI-like enzyme
MSATPSPIRRATEDDVAAIARIVDDAYAHYVPRIGRKPMPMLDDHGARVRAGQAWVFEAAGGAVAGVLVLIDTADHLLLDNIAVDPARRGGGIGRALLQFAEPEAGRRGYAEIRLYTHEKMTENIALYGRIGYRETGRAVAVPSGLPRVHFAKRLSAGAAEIAG